MSIYGIGTDIVKISRIRKVYANFGLKFAQKILSTCELANLQKPSEHLSNSSANLSNSSKNLSNSSTNLSNSTAIDPRFLATRFAAKEACLKAFGTGITSIYTLRSISVIKSNSGKPIIVIDKPLELAIENQIGKFQVHLSISDEQELAIAMVVVELIDS